MKKVEVVSNRNICHGCRNPGHWLPECPKKLKCPLYGTGYVTHMQVLNTSSVNYGRMFFGCSKRECKYFSWEVGQSSGVQCDGGSAFDRSQKKEVKEEVEDLSRLLNTFAKVSNGTGVDITITFSHPQSSTRNDKK